MIFQRCELLLGKENMEKLKNSHILVFGLGGVGGYVVEGLVRSGIGNISIVDFDTVDITNLNRQIIATQDTIDKLKTDCIEKRAKSINPEINITSYPVRFDSTQYDNIFKNKKYDYIVDAIDLVTNKLEIIEIAKKLDIPVISSLGTGNKLNPTDFKVSDIYKTKTCPLARVMRKECKKRDIKNLKVVYSEETPIKTNDIDSREKSVKLGSMAFVPSVAGMIIASEVIKDLCINRR